MKINKRSLKIKFYQAMNKVFTKNLWCTPVWTQELEFKKTLNLLAQEKTRVLEEVGCLIGQEITKLPVGVQRIEQGNVFTLTAIKKRTRTKLKWVKT